MIVSGILEPGIWSHFIHGDDIFDPNRSKNLTLEQMKVEFQKMIDFVKSYLCFLLT